MLLQTRPMRLEGYTGGGRPGGSAGAAESGTWRVFEGVAATIAEGSRGVGRPKTGGDTVRPGVGDVGTR